jgi:hypothetical protein
MPKNLKTCFLYKNGCITLLNRFMSPKQSTKTCDIATVVKTSFPTLHNSGNASGGSTVALYSIPNSLSSYSGSLLCTHKILRSNKQHTTRYLHICACNLNASTWISGTFWAPAPCCVLCFELFFLQYNSNNLVLLAQIALLDRTRLVPDILRFFAVGLWNSQALQKQISQEQDPRSNHATAVRCYIGLAIECRKNDSKQSFQQGVGERFDRKSPFLLFCALRPESNISRTRPQITPRVCSPLQHCIIYHIQRYWLKMELLTRS